MPDPIAPAEPQAQPAVTPPETPANPAKEETDWKVEARKWESRAKENQSAATKLAALEDAQKSEQQKLEDRATTAEKFAAARETDALRARVALEKGLTVAQEKRLVGSTREELLADADELIADLGTPASRTPLSDPSQGPKANTGSQSPAQAFADALNQARGR